MCDHPSRERNVQPGPHLQPATHPISLHHLRLLPDPETPSKLTNGHLDKRRMRVESTIAAVARPPCDLRRERPVAPFHASRQGSRPTTSMPRSHASRSSVRVWSNAITPGP